MSLRDGLVQRAIKKALAAGEITEEDVAEFKRAKRAWYQTSWRVPGERDTAHATAMRLSNALRSKAGLQAKASIKADTAHIRRTTDATAGDLAKMKTMLVDLHNLHMKGKMSVDQETLTLAETRVQIRGIEGSLTTRLEAAKLREVDEAELRQTAKAARRQLATDEPEEVPEEATRGLPTLYRCDHSRKGRRCQKQVRGRTRPSFSGD